MTALSSSGPLQNVYYERKVATARPCYICKRPTSTVLATIKTEDFLYCCDSHLTDPGFATLIAPPAPANPQPTPEDIRKVISDYQARQDRKKDAPNDDKDKGKDKAKEADKKPSSPSPSPDSPIPVTTSPPPAPTHRKFTLHRQIWEMRQRERRGREQAGRAKEVGRGLPQVPGGPF